MTTLGSGARALLAALGMLVLVATPITADTEKGDIGRVGDHHLRDTPALPGATCTYADIDGHMVLQSIRVRPPVVEARDRTAARDRQRVTWRIELMAWVPKADAYWEYHPVQVASSPTMSAPAWEDEAAAFTARTIAIEQDAKSFSIRVRMGWLAPGSTTVEVGHSRHWVDRYRVAEDDAPWTGCLGTVL